MRVRAKQRGIYGPRRWKPGMEFDLDSPRQFNASWMEVVEEAKAEEPKAPAKRKPGRPKKQPKENKPSASEQTEV